MARIKRQAFRGGFSLGVFESENFQSSIKVTKLVPLVGGFIGQGERTRERDRIVEETLRAQGLGDNGIALWLASGAGRHLMDSVDSDMSIRRFRRHVREFTKRAAIDVAIWSHPDSGSLTDDAQVSKHLHQIFAGV